MTLDVRKALRGVVFGVAHAQVVALAVLSMALGGFGLWVDLRAGYWIKALGWVDWLAGPLLGVWVASVAGVTALAAMRWSGRGRGLLERVPGWGVWAMLWPTRVLMGVLAINTIQYAWLYWHDRIDMWPPVPMALVVLVVLVVWVRGFQAWWAAGPGARGGWGAGVVTAGVAGLLVLGQVGMFVLHRFNVPPAGPVDLAVVFGHRVLDDGTASVTLRDRVLAAIELYRQGKVRYLMLSGSLDDLSGHGDFASEVAAMAKVCQEQGVPARAVLQDPVGVNTRATVENSKRLLEKLGLKSVVAVSSASHLARIHLAYWQAGMNVYSVPSRPTEWRQAEPTGTVREFAGLLVYWLYPDYRPAKVQVMPIRLPRIVVHKAAGTLELFDGDRLYKTYRCITGTNKGNKVVEGDRRTPEGRFKVCYKNPESRYHLSLGLDYPNLGDAERGLKEQLISQAEYEQIVGAIRSGGIPNWYTKLGGEIMIHGFAEGRTSTAGCIAVSNPEIEELYAICDVGTVVEVRP